MHGVIWVEVTTFLAEGIAEEKVKKYLEHCDNVIYTKTHDRSILGQIKDFYISISWEIEENLPTDKINLVELNKWKGKLLCGSIGYVYPIDLLVKEFESM